MVSTPRLPERNPAEYRPGSFHVDEFAADKAGSMSPFGAEVEFPLPLDELRYTHPGPEARPRLA